MKAWANILLSIWLILTGLVKLGGISFSGSGTMLAVMAIVAGVLLLIADRSESGLPKIGNTLLGIWLLANGLMPLLHLRFSGSGVVLAVLSIAAGVVLLIQRRA